MHSNTTLATFGQHDARILNHPSALPSSPSVAERLVRIEVTQEYQSHRIANVERELMSMRTRTSTSFGERLKWVAAMFLLLSSAGLLRWPEIAINLVATIGK